MVPLSDIPEIDILQRLRQAFDGDKVPEKNIALRLAFDEIERLRETINRLDQTGVSEIA